MFLIAALLSTPADAAEVVVHHRPVPIVVSTPQVTVTFGNGHADHHKQKAYKHHKGHQCRVAGHKHHRHDIPCGEYQNLPPSKRPQQCR